ncbi:MAG TPA: pilus assembly protein TadG-related protein [Solirubrobacteraceae bacterium]|nr:pilus assembly protein TadG-related protein [Solirubrobacteraceae bacterium]
MRVTTPMRNVLGDEQGGVLVMFVVWLPVLAIVFSLVVDVGNWFEHRRHLQMQADAAALAGAQEFRTCADNAPILAAAAAYGGDTYNAQVGSTPPERVFRLINSKTFYNQPADPDDTVEAGPCEAGMLDVKLTEVDLPWFLPPIGFLRKAVPSKVAFINAQARVSINQLDSSVGALPVGVPDTNPKSARAIFINEDTGAVLGSTNLVKAGTSSGLTIWDNADVPLPVTFASDAIRVGVVIALSGSSSTTCGQPLVHCYDAEAAELGDGTPGSGLVHIRGWSAAGTGAQPDNDPILRDAVLVPGTCADGYFTASDTTCTIGVQADVDFGVAAGVDPRVAVGARLNARVDGKDYALSYDTVTGVWSSALTIPVDPAGDPLPVELEWAETIGTLHGNTCSTGGGNKCDGTFGVVQRTFAASHERSGPIKAVTVSESGLIGANSLERCSAVQTSCTHDLVVRIGVKGSLQNAADASDPIVELRVAGGSQNQSLDCDPNASHLKDELATGCTPLYSRNTGSAPCPGSATTLWGTAQPWTCVAVQTGAAVNQVPAGLNLRILGAEKPASCTAPNNWSSFPNLPEGDPRILEVFLTPFGSFDGSGSTTVPVTDFATFYVTGWDGKGEGFGNPCTGNGDDPLPDPKDSGVIVGHFIKYIQNTGTGSGTTPCDPDSFGSCIAVMTR